MPVNLCIWEKLTKLVIFLLFVVGIAAVCMWYVPLIRQNESMRQQLLQLDQKVKQQEEKGRMLRASVEALKNDPRAVERLARARFAYAKPGEIVVRFEDYPGRWMFHCHILDHEDMGMMGILEIR